MKCNKTKLSREFTRALSTAMLLLAISGLRATAQDTSVNANKQQDATGQQSLSGVWSGKGRGFTLKLEITQTGNSITGRKSVAAPRDQLFVTSFQGTIANQSATFHDTEIQSQTSGGPTWCPAKNFLLTVISPAALQAQWDAPPCPSGKLILNNEGSSSEGETTDKRQPAGQDRGGRNSISNHAVDFSIAGISLDMSPPEVKAKLGSGFSYSEAKFPNDPALELFGAVKGIFPNETEQQFGFLFLKERLVYLTRSIRFVQNAQPNYPATASQLLEKFGPATKTIGNDALSGNYMWEYGKMGNVLSDTQYLALGEDCPYQGQQHLGIPSIPGVANFHVDIPGAWNRGCYRQAQSVLSYELENRQLVSDFILTIEDQSLMYEHVLALQQQEQDKLKQAAKDAEKRKAPL